MQTFLPYRGYAESVAVLDDKRLGKQRVETLQIFAVLVRLRWRRPDNVIEDYEPKGWKNHPAVLGWKGYEASLLEYQRATCAEWTARLASGLPDDTARPPWTHDPAVHRSHQSNLIRKDPDFYGPLFPGVPGDLEYVWPAMSEATTR